MMCDNLYNENEFLIIMNEKFNKNEPVNLTVTGGSMVPFLVHKRDTVILTPVDENVKKGDILFYRRKNGKCVLHRVKNITDDGIYFIGDSQDKIEGPLDINCILAKCDSVIRKNRIINQNSIIWKFFRIVWLNIIPLRLPLIKIYSKIKK